MKTCKKCLRSEPAITFSSLAPNYCTDCCVEENRKATAILDSYNKLRNDTSLDSADKNTLEKVIEYAEKLKEYHFEGILDLIGGIGSVDQVISIYKEQLEKLDRKRERERENPLLSTETII